MTDRVKVNGYVEIPASKWWEIIDKFTRIDELLEIAIRLLDRTNRLLEGLYLAEGKTPPLEVGAIRVELPPYNYLFYIDTLFRWLEHAGVVTPVIVEAPITVNAGDKGYADLWLPPNIACIERVFEVYFPTCKGIKYGWAVDSTSDYTVPMHYFIPNKGYVEESVFGKYWIKWYFLRFYYEAYDSGTIVVRAWARLISHDNLERMLKDAEPLAELLNVKFPPPRPVPTVTASELIKKCPICRAEMLRKDDGTIVRIGKWGRSYTDHKCEVFG